MFIHKFLSYFVFKVLYVILCFDKFGKNLTFFSALCAVRGVPLVATVARTCI